MPIQRHDYEAYEAAILTGQMLPDFVPLFLQANPEFAEWYRPRAAARHHSRCQGRCEHLNTVTEAMTLGQYRALVAYMNFWTPHYPEMDLAQAMKDCGIDESRRDDVISELFAVGWDFDEDTGLLSADEYEYDDE